MASSNSEVAHNWANQTGRKCNGGNMHYEGESLYSYSTEIARIVNNGSWIIVTDHSYSVTTSGKHKNQIRRAANHLERFAYSGHLRELSRDWERAKIQVLEDYESSFLADIESIKRKRSGLERSLEWLSHKADKIELLQSICEGVTDEYHALRIAETIEQRIEVINKYWSVDFTHKLELERTYDQRYAANAEKREKARLKREEKQAQLEAEQAAKELENAQLWRVGQYHGQLHRLPPMLRCLDGQTLQTSHGASVGLEIAKWVYQGLLDGKNIEGLQLDGFTVREVTDTHIKIGCHTFPRAEIDSFFNVVQ